MVLRLLRNCVEIPLALSFFGFLLTSTITSNFIIYRTCYVTLGFNQTDCEKLGTGDGESSTNWLEEIVQPYSNVVIMAQSVLTQIVPAILCLVVGPWSDRNGRKPIIVLSFVGFIVRGIITMVVVLFPHASPWYLLIGSFLTAFMGGLAPVITIVLCYVTDITTEENRGMRMTAVEAMTATGMLLGTICSSFVFAWGGYVLVYSIEIACNVIGCLYTIFIVSETVPPYSSEDYQDKPSILSFKHIIEMFKTLFARRELHGRTILWLTFAVATIGVLVFAADASVAFVFIREKFHWDLEHYTLFSGISSLSGIAGTIVGILLLHKLLKVSEAPLIILGLLAYLASALVLGFARFDWQLYLASGVRSLNGIYSPMCRSLISKVLSREEIGKVFSVAVTVDSLAAIVGGQIYTLIYNLTLSTNPGTFNFVSAGLTGINIGLAVIVLIVQRRAPLSHSYAVLPPTTEVD